MTHTKKNTSLLVLLLTRKCELNCQYCEITKKDKDLTVEELYKAIDFLFTSKEKNLELQFFGGEPLLRFDLINKGIQYGEKLATEKNKKIQYTITTNGVSLTEQKLQFLSAYDTSFIFSLDGSKETNQCNRVAYKIEDSIYDKIINNILLAKDYGIPFFINMTVTPLKTKTILKDFYYLSKQGFKDIQVVYSLGTKWSEKKEKQFIAKLKKIEKFTQKNKMRSPFDVLNEPTLTSPPIIVDVDNSLYVGCSIVLEKNIPNLNKENYAGNLDEIQDINQLRRTHLEQLVKILLSDKLTNKEREIVENNILVGICLLENTEIKDNSLLLELNLNSENLSNCGSYESNRETQHMSKETLYRGIYLAFQSTKKHIKLKFYNNKPFLQFSLLEKGVIYAEELAKKAKKKVYFFLETGDLLLDQERINFIKNHKISIIFKMHQTFQKKIQHSRINKENKKYNDSLDYFLPNYYKMKEADIPHFINLVVKGKDLDSLRENVNFLINRLNVKNVLISPILGYHWSLSEQKEYFRLLSEMIRNNKLKEENFLNLQKHYEPAIASTSFNLNFDGNLYFGCTPRMEKTFPSFKKINYVGDVETVKEPPAKPNYMRQIINLIDSKEMVNKEKNLVINNLLFGIKNKVFFDMLRTKKP